MRASDGERRSKSRLSVFLVQRGLRGVFTAALRSNVCAEAVSEHAATTRRSRQFYEGNTHKSLFLRRIVAAEGNSGEHDKMIFIFFIKKIAITTRRYKSPSGYRSFETRNKI